MNYVCYDSIVKEFIINKTKSILLIEINSRFEQYKKKYKNVQIWYNNGIYTIIKK